MSRAGVQNGKCKICAHPERARIEHLVLSGASLKATAHRFDLHYGSLQRHMNNHISEAARSAAVRRALRPGVAVSEIVEDSSEGILENLALLRQKLWHTLDACLEVGDANGVNNTAGRLHENLTMFSKLCGQWQKFAKPTTQNILISTDFREVVSLLQAIAMENPSLRDKIIHQINVMERRALADLTQANDTPPVRPKTQVIDAEVVDDDGAAALERALR